ncbi:MAG: hypothetical protein LBF24_02900 [Puniceicoccales bacterium]|jgi:hypothetical protein|nr:hypothetical protein [Puniceicoccales bacterium]
MATDLQSPCAFPREEAYEPLLPAYEPKELGVDGLSIQERGQRAVRITEENGRVSGGKGSSAVQGEGIVPAASVFAHLPAELLADPADVVPKPISGMPASAGAEDPILPIENMQNKVEALVQGVEDLRDRGSATAGNMPRTIALTAALTNADAAAAAGHLSPKDPRVVAGRAAMRRIDRILTKVHASNREPTANEAKQIGNNTARWIGGLAAQGVIDPVFAAEQQGRLRGALRAGARGATPADGGMTTGDIMALIAEVLTKAADNANEMRYQESQASLSGIQASRREAEMAAELKKQSAEKDRSAAEKQATGQIVSGFVSGLTALIGGGLTVAKPAVSQVFSQVGSSAGSVTEGFFKLQAAGLQLSSKLDLAQADLVAAYGQQDSTLAQRTQSSAQDQGQLMQTLIRAFNELISAMNQTIIAQTQAVGR